MWNKREEPTPPPQPPTQRPPAYVPPTPNPIEAKKEQPPMSSSPFKSPESDMSRGAATIGKAVKIIGQIFSKEDLYVDGDVEGTIECQDNKLTIGPNGKLQAAVRAREVIVLGQIKGNVEAADRIEIRKDARLVGDIKTARIKIEDDAYFKGSIDIVKADAKSAARPAQVATPVASSTTP
jgi:cytoskeletal protein CcmA (bactofilin family)